MEQIQYKKEEVALLCSVQLVGVQPITTSVGLTPCAMVPQAITEPQPCLTQASV